MFLSYKEYFISNSFNIFKSLHLFDIFNIFMKEIFFWNIFDEHVSIANEICWNPNLESRPENLSTLLYLSRNWVKFVSPLHYILVLLWKILAFAYLQNFEKFAYYAGFCRQIPFHVLQKKCSSISKRNAGDGIFDSQFITTLDSFKKLSFLTGLRRKSKLRNLELLMLIWIDNFEVHIIQHEYVQHCSYTYICDPTRHFVFL